MTNYEIELTDRIRELVAHNRRLRTWWPAVAVMFAAIGYWVGVFVGRKP
jgi:hypothetical protein